MNITNSEIKNAQKDINFFYIDGKPKEFIYRDLVKNHNIKLLDIISIERGVKKLNEKAIKKGYRLKENGDVFLDMSLVLRPHSKLFEPTRQKNIYKVLKDGMEIEVKKQEYILLYGILNYII
jgi:hypothetical protein